jgi:hypothetical protein
MRLPDSRCWRCWMARGFINSDCSSKSLVRGWSPTPPLPGVRIRRDSGAIRCSIGINQAESWLGPLRR